LDYRTWLEDSKINNLLSPVVFGGDINDEEYS
jgi:hypothetical protein